jgi:hemerythrin-like domain-containing protein
VAIGSATDRLRDEHELILRALLILDSAAERLGAGGALPEQRWTDTIGWLRDFADRNHHAKEETALFPAMLDAGVPAERGPLAGVLVGPTEGRARLAP